MVHKVIIPYEVASRMRNLTYLAKAWLCAQANNHNSDLFEFLLFLKSVWKIRVFILTGVLLGSFTGLYLGLTIVDTTGYYSKIGLQFKNYTIYKHIENKQGAMNSLLSQNDIITSIFTSFFKQASFSSTKEDTFMLMLDVRSVVNRQTGNCGANPKDLLLRVDNHVPYLFYHHTQKLTIDDAQLLVTILNDHIRSWKDSFNDRMKLLRIEQQEFNKRKPLFGSLASQAIEVDQKIKKDTNTYQNLDEIILNQKSIESLNQFSSKKIHFFMVLGAFIGCLTGYILGVIYFLIARSLKDLQSVTDKHLL